MAEFLYKSKPLSKETIDANLDRLKELKAYCVWREQYIKQIMINSKSLELINNIKNSAMTNDMPPKLNYEPPSLNLFRKIYTKN